GIATGGGRAAGSAPATESPATESPVAESPATKSPATDGPIIDNNVSGPIPPQVPVDKSPAAAPGPAGRTAIAAESIAAAAVLRSAGWHVTIIDASTPLAVAWQRLPRAAEMLVAAAGRPDGSPA
ncbi:MAG TPA: hypothetical protein VGH53_11175, partial [Streptosporangiaceae bacterium]